MDIPSHAEFVERVEAFLTRHDMAETTFGRRATGEPGLVKTLREGRQPRLDMMHRVKDFMDAKDAELAGGEHGQPDSAAIPMLSAGKAEQVSVSEAQS